MSAEMAATYYRQSGDAGIHPLGRVGRPAEIGEMAAFLADSSKAGFMTGTTVYVDGGRLLTMSTATAISTGAPATPAK